MRERQIACVGPAVEQKQYVQDEILSVEQLSQRIVGTEAEQASKTVRFEGHGGEVGHGGRAGHGGPDLGGTGVPEQIK